MEHIHFTCVEDSESKQCVYSSEEEHDYCISKIEEIEKKNI